MISTHYIRHITIPLSPIEVVTQMTLRTLKEKNFDSVWIVLLCYYFFQSLSSLLARQSHQTTKFTASSYLEINTHARTHAHTGITKIRVCCCFEMKLKLTWNLLTLFSPSHKYWDYKFFSTRPGKVSCFWEQVHQMYLTDVLRIPLWMPRISDLWSLPAIFQVGKVFS